MSHFGATACASLTFARTIGEVDRIIGTRVKQFPAGYRRIGEAVLAGAPQTAMPDATIEWPRWDSNPHALSST